MIRNLLVLLFITSSTALVAASTPFIDSAVQQAYVNQETLRLERKLGLNAPQTVQVKAAMEAVVNGNATQTVTEVLQEICTPAQFAVWKEEVVFSCEHSAANMAAAETDRLAKTTNLSAAQKSEVKASFYQIELNDRMFQCSHHTDAELQEHLYHVATDKENVMEKFMSPAQLKEKSQAAANGLNNPLPDLPALSFSEAVPTGL